MPAYAYTGLNSQGRTIKGVVSADTVAAATSASTRTWRSATAGPSSGTATFRR